MEAQKPNENCLAGGKKDTPDHDCTRGVKAVTQKTKHTPGPWKLNGYKVITPNSRFSIAVIGAEPATKIESEANARLIAAAPELLEACRIALQGLEDYETDNPEWENNLTADIRTLKTAIAKAEGRA